MRTLGIGPAAPAHWLHKQEDSQLSHAHMHTKTQRPATVRSCVLGVRLEQTSRRNRQSGPNVAFPSGVEAAHHPLNTAIRHAARQFHSIASLCGRHLGALFNPINIQTPSALGEVVHRSVVAGPARPHTGTRARTFPFSSPAPRARAWEHESWRTLLSRKSREGLAFCADRKFARTVSSWGGVCSVGY